MFAFPRKRTTANGGAFPLGLRSWHFISKLEKEHQATRLLASTSLSNKNTFDFTEVRSNKYQGRILFGRMLSCAWILIGPTCDICCFLFTS